MSLELEYEWLAILDDHTCDECADLDTQIFTAGDAPEQPHVNCRCELIPIMPEIPEIGVNFEAPENTESLYNRIVNYIKNKFGKLF